MNQSIGLIIRSISEEKKISVTVLAERLNKSRQYVYTAFAKLRMSRAEMEEWAKALEISSEEIERRINDSGSSAESTAFAQDTLDRIIAELKLQYESRITELKDQIGDLREQLKFNREMVQAFKEGHLGKSEGAIVRPLHIAARA